MDATRTTLRRHRGAFPTISAALALLAACSAPSREPSTTAPAPTTRATTTVDQSEEGPAVPPIDVCPLLTLEETDAILGLLDLPLSERGIFTFEGGESCRWLHEGDEERFVEIAPGSPDDFADGAELAEASAVPMAGVGEAVVWFGGDDLGVLSVVARTRLASSSFDSACSGLTWTTPAVCRSSPGWRPACFPGSRGWIHWSAASTWSRPTCPTWATSTTSSPRKRPGSGPGGEELVTTLRLFLGEVEATEALRASELESTEGTGIFALAEEYLATGDDGEATAEVARLLEVLVFTNEELEALAGIGQPTASLIDLAAPSSDCSAFFYGYSTLPTGVGPCLEFQSVTFDGKHYRVF